MAVVNPMIESTRTNVGRPMDAAPAVDGSSGRCAPGLDGQAPPSRPHEGRVGGAEADGDRAGQDERVAPAPGVDEIAGEQRGRGNPEVPEHAVDGDGNAGLPPSLYDHRDSDGVVDGGEHTHGEQSQRDLHRRVRQRRQDRAHADADEEDDDHAGPAPLVRHPSGRNRTDPERDEPRRGVRDQRRVAHVPLFGKPQRRHRGEDQHEEMVEEMPEVEEKEVQAVA